MESETDLLIEQAGEAHERDAEGPPLRVLLCPDRPSWSFDNIANNIARFADRHRVHKLYMRDVIGNEHLLFQTIFLNRIDVCHIFWREDLFYMLHPRTIDKAAGALGLDYETMARAINSCAFTTSVYDHLFSTPEEMQERRTGFAMIDGYTACSRKLDAIYASASGIPPPDAVIQDGIDTDRFTPRAGRREQASRLAVGWVGNSAWGKQSQGYDVKGYHRLFLPMLERLQERGYAVEPRVADPQVRHIPFDAMPDFYRDLDVFICTSAIEGTPNPVLEAMASAVPVVSTDVGIVPEAFGDLQRRFILRHPTVEGLVDAVAELLADEGLRNALGEENRARALEWRWEEKARLWWPFWRRMVRRAADPRHAMRRESYLIAQAVIL